MCDVCHNVIKSLASQKQEMTGELAQINQLLALIQVVGCPGDMLGHLLPFRFTDFSIGYMSYHLLHEERRVVEIVEALGKSFRTSRVAI